MSKTFRQLIVGRNQVKVVYIIKVLKSRAAIEVIYSVEKTAVING